MGNFAKVQYNYNICFICFYPHTVFRASPIPSTLTALKGFFFSPPPPTRCYTGSTVLLVFLSKPQLEAPSTSFFLLPKKEPRNSPPQNSPKWALFPKPSPKSKEFRTLIVLLFHAKGRELFSPTQDIFIMTGFLLAKISFWWENYFVCLCFDVNFPKKKFFDNMSKTL